jgi:hypothetical protein
MPGVKRGKNMRTGEPLMVYPPLSGEDRREKAAGPIHDGLIGKKNRFNLIDIDGEYFKAAEILGFDRKTI